MNPLSNRLRGDSLDPEASQKSSGYTVELLDGSRVVRSIEVEDRSDAVSLAYDMMRFAATSYNAIGNRQGDDRLMPEQTQSSPGREEDGTIVVEWAVIPDGTSRYQACRVTKGNPSGTLTESYDSDEPIVVEFILL